MQRPKVLISRRSVTMASLVIALASPKSRCGLLYARRDGDLKRAVDRGAQLGLAWYSREGWESLRELADDPWSLDDTFEDWERGALAAIRELESIGRRVRRVPIDVNALARLVPRATPPYRQCRASRIRHLPDTAGRSRVEGIWLRRIRLFATHGALLLGRRSLSDVI